MSPLIIAVISIVALLLVAAMLVGAMMVSRKKRLPSATPEVANMTIDLDALELPQTSEHAVTLDIYSVPTQLAVLVLAPAGRGYELPEKEQWRTLLEQICPGFAQVLDQHRPVFRRWPAQVSNKGFERAFFGNMRESESSKGTHHWYKLAGKIDWFDRQILIGLVAYTTSMTPLAPVEVDHSGKWREILKVGHVR